MKEITKKTKIFEAIKKNPKNAEVLIREGLFCVYCPLASQETLEQGLKAHGKNEKEIEKIIKKLNSTK
ncbi:disulfide oxidoreductase [Candidatus Woesearchaeota archaeon]|nr:MAG: disulfide oxidoreductase [Candidatus Woesearchaeota archaeon]